MVRTEVRTGDRRSRRENKNFSNISEERYSRRHTAATDTSRITVGTLNIVDGRNNRLEMACRELKRTGVDIAILTETKLRGYHTVSSYGYEIAATKAAKRNQGGVALLTRKDENWHVEGVKSFGPNVIKGMLVHGDQFVTIVGTYIPPSEMKLETIEFLDEALKNVNEKKLILLGDFNVNYEKPKDERTTDIVNALKTYNLKNIAKEFKSTAKKPFSWTWRRWREGRKIQSVCDYILRGESTKWKNFKMVDMNLDTDHRLIKGQLIPGGKNNYKSYIKKRKSAGVKIFGKDKTEESTETNKLMKELKEAVKTEKQQSKKDRSWISERTFKLLREKVKALRNNDQDLIRDKGREVRRSLRQDRRERIRKVSAEIEQKLEKEDIIGAFDTLKHWYKKFSGIALKPLEEDLEKTRETYSKLFEADDLETKLPFDFEYSGNAVEDRIPDEEEISRALFRMRSRKAPGLSNVTIDDIKVWYEDAYPEEGEGNEEAMCKWKKVVNLVQKCIGEGVIPQAFEYGILVIIPKDDTGGVRGIGLLESIHKLISQVINLRMATSIQFCEEVHGFRKQRGTFTAIGETKIRTQMATCNSETLYQVFLDLRKAYDSIDRGRVLKLLEKYKVGPNLRRYINNVWQKQHFVLRQAGFYSKPINVERGCTQGDTDSPIIFNIIVDAVLRKWKNRRDWEESRAYFYADDGLIENNDPDKLQKDLDAIIDLFKEFGLNTNETKTKFMIVRGAKAPKAQSQDMYNRLQRQRRGEERREKSFSEQQKERVICNICGKEMGKASLKRHFKEKHGHVPKKYKSIETSELETGTFQMEEIVKGKFNACPVENCQGGGRDKFGIYRHFCFRHPTATVVIRQDGLLPKCELCGMHTRDVKKHQRTKTCEIGRGRRLNEQKQVAQARADSIDITVNGISVERVKRFKYLGRILTENDDDTLCIEEQIKKARQRWGGIANILKREGANAKTMAKFYLTIVQALLLYGADSWTISKKNLQKLNSFHKRAVRHMTGRHIRKVGENQWEYPKHKELLTKCGLFPIKVYIQRRRGTLQRFMEENRSELMSEAQKIEPHCKDIGKILWWKQKYLTKREWKGLKYP